MTSQERKDKIFEITGGNYFSSDGKGKRLRYSGSVRTFIEYEIPLDYIIYNVENGRIASLVKSFEREQRTLNPEEPEDEDMIASFLYDSNAPANIKTKKNLIDNGQLETGIITSDGVLVDGNRRVSLMRQILKDEKLSPDERTRCEKFRAVVLPEDADKKEILRLETTFQMGSDEKVGYNAIEKYLHARDLQDQGFSTNDIAEYMNLEKVTDVNVLLQVMTLIDEYLDYFDYTGIYTRLPKGFEDDMLKLNTALKKIKDGGISWIPTDRLTEVENDLKCLCFDYIRLNAKSQDGFFFRSIASTSGANFLVNEDVWNSFVNAWKSTMEKIPAERPVEEILKASSSPNESNRLLEAHDNAWRKEVKEGLLDAFNDAQTTVNNKKEKEKPAVLLKRALNAVQQIDLSNIASSSDKIYIKNLVNSLMSFCKDAETKF